MGYKGYGSHGQWDTWAMGYMGNRGTGVWAMGPMGNLLPNIKKMSSCPKKMSSCQKDVKYQKMKHLDYGGGSQKN